MDVFDKTPAQFKRQPNFTGGNEMSGLNTLLAAMNNPNIPGMVMPTKEEMAAPTPPPAPPPPELKPLSSNVGTSRNLIFFTGRLKSGKDYIATAAGAKIFGFADPIYQLASHFFGVEVTSTSNKDLPGMRAALQLMGQWAKGVISDKYPVTPARALFVESVRRKAFSLPATLLVDWASYGTNQTIWLDACMRRVAVYQEENPGARVAITNARFDFEVKALKDAGWRHFHVMCSTTTWKARLAESKMTPESPTVKDISEALAHAIDSDVVKRTSAQRAGSRLAVIWNDNQPRISDRLHTLESFLQSLGVAAGGVAPTESDNMAFE